MRIYISLFLFLTLLATNTMAQTNGRSRWMPDWDSLYRGTPYVPFEIITLDGKKVTNDYFKGKVTFIDLWFEGCAGCREEFGKVNELYDSIKINPAFQFIAITFDSLQTIPGFIKQYGLRYPIATTGGDNDKFGKLKYGMGCPSKIILDKGGKIAFIGMKDIGSSAFSHQLSINKYLSFMRSLE